jgi:hypothetical protein
MIDELRNVIGVTFDKSTVELLARCKPNAGGFEQFTVDIDRDNKTGDLCKICNVNQPSPEHRSITSMSDFKPTFVSTPAGSGHRASHHPGSGIPVPSKKPGLAVKLCNS